MVTEKSNSGRVTVDGAKALTDLEFDYRHSEEHDFQGPAIAAMASEA